MTCARCGMPFTPPSTDHTFNDCFAALRAALAAAEERLAAIENAPESKIEDWLDEYAASVMQDIAGTPTGNGMIEFSDRPSRRTVEARTWLLNAYRNRGLKLARLEEALREIGLMCASGFYGRDNHGYAAEAKRIARAALAEEGK